MFGGALAEPFGWFRTRQEAWEVTPIWARSVRYWLVTIAMILAGGVLVFAYLRSGLEMSPIVAINVGASAPLMISTLIGQTPKIPPGRVD